MNSNRQEQEKRYLKIEQSVFQMKISCGSVIHRGQKRIRSMAGSDDVKCYIPLFGLLGWESARVIRFSIIVAEEPPIMKSKLSSTAVVLIYIKAAI